MKTIEEKQLEVRYYLTKTQSHLFKTKRGDLFKIIPFKIDGELYVCSVRINKEGLPSSKVRKVFMYSEDNIKQTWKNRYFPYSIYEKEDAVAIKHFNSINVFFGCLKDKLTTDNDKNVELMESIIKIKNLTLNFVDKQEK
jgi:hypothetical protein